MKHGRIGRRERRAQFVTIAAQLRYDTNTGQAVRSLWEGWRGWSLHSGATPVTTEASSRTWNWLGRWEGSRRGDEGINCPKENNLSKTGYSQTKVPSSWGFMGLQVADTGVADWLGWPRELGWRGLTGLSIGWLVREGRGWLPTGR